MTTSDKTAEAPRPMTEEEIERAAYADPDAQPLAEADFKRMKRTRRQKLFGGH